MQDVAMRRRLAALVVAALLAISGAALATAFFAADEQAKDIRGTFGQDDAQALRVNDGDAQDG